MHILRVSLGRLLRLKLLGLWKSTISISLDFANLLPKVVSSTYAQTNSTRWVFLVHVLSSLMNSSVWCVFPVAGEIKHLFTSTGHLFSLFYKTPVQDIHPFFYLIILPNNPLLNVLNTKPLPVVCITMCLLLPCDLSFRLVMESSFTKSLYMHLVKLITCSFYP